MAERKPNQGMQRPSLGGIGSRIADARVTNQVCAHAKPWRLNAESKIICGVCHPPADGLDVEWVDAGSEE